MSKNDKAKDFQVGDRVVKNGLVGTIIEFYAWDDIVTVKFDKNSAYDRVLCQKCDLEHYIAE